MAATHSSSSSPKMKKIVTCRRSIDQLTRQASNLSNYDEGYHGDETASVPFTWESQPGTPKHQFRRTILPPLTPPPSYYYSSPTPRSTLKSPKNCTNSSSASKSNPILQSILPKRTARKSRAASPPPPLPPANSSPALSFSSSSSSSSSSYQPWQRSRSVPTTPVRRMRKEKGDEEDVYDDKVRGLGMCFGNRGLRGCCSSMMKVMVGDFL